MVMVDPEDALRLTLVGDDVNDNVPLSTWMVIELKLVSASDTLSSLLLAELKSMAVSFAVVTVVVDEELIAVPLKLLTGGSFAPVMLNVMVVVDVAPAASLTS